MMLPEYWLERPHVEFNEETKLSFDALLKSTLALGVNPVIEYTLPNPKWQFLCYLAEHQGIALHGSGNPNITLFEPRQPVDLSEFGNQKAVYAAADGIWAMFFAIIDRDQYEMSITNACIRLVDQEENTSGPFYQFSMSKTVLERQPWRIGTVYLLPRTTFIEQPPMSFGSSQVQIAQLASLSSLQPLARLQVSANDFPFLKQIRGHDDSRLQEYTTALQTGAPWPDDQ